MDKLDFRPLDYRVGTTTIRVEYCDITTTRADVLVSSDDIDLSMGGGVSAALRRSGGKQVWEEAHQQAPIPIGGLP